jgi:hypothetical protein
MAATSLLHRRTDIQARSTSIGHGRKVLGRKTLDEMRKRKMMRRRKIVIKELGFFPLANMLYL